MNNNFSFQQNQTRCQCFKYQREILEYKRNLNIHGVFIRQILSLIDQRIYVISCQFKQSTQKQSTVFKKILIAGIASILLRHRPPLAVCEVTSAFSRQINSPLGFNLPILQWWTMLLFIQCLIKSFTTHTVLG